MDTLFMGLTVKPPLWRARYHFALFVVRLHFGKKAK